MCYKPIQIFNRSRRFDKHTDSSVLSVPCGHCSECINKKQQDWLVRASAEYKRVKDKGGFVWFASLTYRNEDLPIWNDKEFGFKAPVFDKSHFVSFRNKLRIYLKRNGADFKGENTIRYIYVSEYGTDKGRSHLHVLLFVPSPYPFLKFKALVKKAWIYGYVGYSKEWGYTLKSIQGVKYTLKYMNKQLLWYEKYGVDDYITKLKQSISLLSDGDERKDRLRARLCKFRKCLPHHCQSMGFGSTLDLSESDFEKGTITANRIGFYNSTFVYNIPMYYKRKFMYDYDKSQKLFTINGKGLYIKVLQFNKLVDRLDKYYVSLIFSTYVHDVIVSLFPSLFDHPLYCYYKQLSDYDTKDLAIYQLVYRGKCPDGEFIYDSNCTDKEFFLYNQRKNALRFYVNNLDNREVCPIDDYKLNGSRESAKESSFADCNVYTIFENGIKFLELFKSRLGDVKQDYDDKESKLASIQFGK